MDDAANNATRRTRPRLTPVQRVARHSVLHKFQGLRVGSVKVQDGHEEHVFGCPDAEVRAELRIESADAYLWAATGGTLGCCEALMEGLASTPDPVALARVFIANRDVMTDLETGLGRLREPLARLRHRLRRNTPSGARRNIRAHYDLGNEFFELFLDPTLMYSSAQFVRPDMTLHEAQCAKIRRICDKLELRPGDHLLEIGTGWGELALHAAREYGCRVTTTTVSPAQYELARARIAAEGLSDRVTVLLQDYRSLRGQYDKLVSIEMVEAVGHPFYDQYFQVCSDRLKPDGMFLLQAIHIEDRHYVTARDSVDFMKRYIFPGCCIPSVSVLSQSAARVSNLRMFHLEDFAPDYAQTLALWRKNFHASHDKIKQLGFDERFIRMWDWYLASCEAGFEERLLGVVQILWTKPASRRAPLYAGTSPAPAKTETYTPVSAKGLKWRHAVPTSAVTKVAS